MTDRRRPSAARTTVSVWALAIAFLGAGLSTASAAEDRPSPEEQPPKWELDVLSYGWVTGTYGTLDVQGNTVQIDVTPSDVVNLLLDGNAFAAAGYFSLSYDRFSVFADAMGGYAEVSVNERIPTQLCTLSVRARDEARFVFADFGLGYRLGQWTLPGRRRRLTLGAYVGTRYMYFSSDLAATAGVVGGVQRSADVFESFAWADPLIGVRWSLPVLDWASVDFRGDIGGFGASSDLIWGLVGTTRVWVPWKPLSTQPYLAAGYRVVALDRSKSGDELDLQFRGPVVGAGFVF